MSYIGGSSGGSSGSSESEFPRGSSTSGTVALGTANVWVAVVTPTVDSVIEFTPESPVVGTLRWSFANESVPSTTYGNRFTSSRIINLASGLTLYVGSSVIGDRVNWTMRGIS